MQVQLFTADLAALRSKLSGRLARSLLMDSVVVGTALYFKFGGGAEEREAEMRAAGEEPSFLREWGLVALAAAMPLFSLIGARGERRSAVASIKLLAEAGEKKLAISMLGARTSLLVPVERVGIKPLGSMAAKDVYEYVLTIDGSTFARVPRGGHWQDTAKDILMAQEERDEHDVNMKD